MEPSKRVRSSNWTEEEKKVLKKLILERAHIIENKDTTTNSNSAKKDAWEQVLSRFNTVCVTKRDIAQLQTQWRNSKNKAKKSNIEYRSALLATGGGPSTTSPSPDDREIYEAIPHEYTVISNKYDSDSIYNKKKDVTASTSSTSSYCPSLEVRTSPPPTPPTETPVATPKKKLKKYHQYNKNCCCIESHEHQLFMLAKESRIKSMMYEEEKMEHEREMQRMKMKNDREMQRLKMKNEREMHERKLHILKLEIEYWRKKNEENK